MHRQRWASWASPLVVTIAAVVVPARAPAGTIDRCSFTVEDRSVTIRLAPEWERTEIKVRGADDEIRVDPTVGRSPDCDGARLDDIDHIRVRGSAEDDGVKLPGWPGITSAVRLEGGRHDSVSILALQPDMVVTGRTASTASSTVRFSDIEVLEIDEPSGLDASGVIKGLPIVVPGGNGTLIGGPSDDRLNGGTGVDRLVGGGGDDVLHGHAGHDEIEGGPGSDTVDSSCACGELGDGADQLTGGAGRDRLSYAYRDPYDQSVASVVITSDGTPCSGADVDQDGDACDPVDERDSVDSFEVFATGWSSDTLYGMPGVDETFVPWGNDVVVGNAGDHETLDVSALDRRDGVSVDVAAGTADGERGSTSFAPADAFVRLVGSWGPDTFVDEGSIGRAYITGAGGDLIVAGGGDDRLRGGGQPDEIRGGAGDDRLIGDEGDDRLVGGAGLDVSSGGRGSDRCRAEIRRGCEWPSP